MNTKKIIVALLSLFVLSGCQSQTRDVKEYYQGLDAKATYKKLNERMKTEVTYYLITCQESKSSTAYREYYRHTNKIQSVFKRFEINEAGQPSLLYSVQTAKNLHILSPATSQAGPNGPYMLSTTDHTVEKTDEDFYDSKSNIEGVERIDHEDSITLRFTIESTDPDVANKRYVNEINIGKNGLIESSRVYYYTDDTYTTLQEEPFLVAYYSNYNAKKQADLDKEAQRILSCKNKTYDDIYEQIAVK